MNSQPLSSQTVFGLGPLSGNRARSLYIVLCIAFLAAVAPGELSGQSSAQRVQRPAFSWSEFQPGKPPATTQGTLVLGREIYLNNCAVCHGETGRGNGWRAKFLFPRPRDFSRGIFRFKSTPSGSLPTDQDLFRTVSIGVQGTAMSGWRTILSDAERWAVVEHLKKFSRFFEREAPGEPVRLGVEPPITPERVERGKQIYLEAGCVECHGTQGYGDGLSSRGMEDSFGHPITPRNLHVAEEFKRGRTLRDVALTIATGNDGTPMPSFSGALSQDQAWALASFVMSLEEEPPQFRAPLCPMMARGTR